MLGIEDVLQVELRRLYLDSLMSFLNQTCMPNCFCSSLLHNYAIMLWRIVKMDRLACQGQ